MNLLRDIERDRKNAVSLFHGPVAISTLPLEEARALIVAANTERARRRELAHSPVSESEIDLLAAFLWYGERPELQHAVGPYDADFYFPRYSTAIEVDGRHHIESWIRDRRRDRYFDSVGIRTMRVPAKVVWRDPLKAASDVAQDMVFKWIRAA